MASEEKIRFSSCLVVLKVAIVSAYQPNPALPASTVRAIVKLFVEARELAPGLTDGSSAPAYSLRSLAQAMQYVAHAAPLHGTQQALFDGFCMAFAGMLEEDGQQVINAIVQKHVLEGRHPPGLPSASKMAASLSDRSYDRVVNVEVWCPRWYLLL